MTTPSAPAARLRVYHDTQGLPLAFYLRQDGETVAVLLEDIVYDAGPLGRIVVPKGFESDGCSLPRFFWRMIGHPFDMRYLREAIFHDWLYRHQPCDRKTADLIFRYALEISGRVHPDVIKSIYRGLRIGGWKAWNRHRDEIWAAWQRIRDLAEAPTAELT